MSIGKSLPHDAAPLQVTGEARYIDDIPLPRGALHLAFGLSTEAHARITTTDLSAVRAAPGVVAVLSAEDFALCRAAGVSCRGNQPPCRAQGGASGQDQL